ncbi:Ankyrin repeat [Maridesulfovibrio ferrireducens]|uniref:Ankyrin repeat n=1 Tax=Maridesulfovibrio ferrireducens TaxID=246191 RepID=A0A1G9LFR2_9BACT|nr:ankyrin repeat domain-containing protein [Maridesulfovibrio ferrireducens]SDL60770.1 Ankyrin repeat [Maridesulfovibrio ferrireducens]
MRNVNVFQISVIMLSILCAATPLFAKGNKDTRPPLYRAINQNDFAKAKAAIQLGADVNAIYDRDSMLCWALRNENTDITKLILQSPRVNVNQRSVSYDAWGEWERTPLILASHMGQAEMVSILLQKGAKPNEKDRTDSTPESRGNTALIKAAQRDHADVIKVLVTQGAGLNIHAQTKNGQTALWFISECEDLETLKFLHEHGAKINIADNHGSSVLVTTFLHKNREVLDYLFANGADINHVNHSGITPLMDAILLLGDDNAKTVFNFIQNFLTLNPKLDLQKIVNNNGGCAALHLTARFGFVDCANLLLKNGASINLKSLDTGRTPLHVAASANHIDMAKCLIEHNAKLELVDKTGSTPLIVAVIHSDADMVRVLVNAGADINTKSTANILVTPLIKAASNPDPFKHKANLAIIKALLSGKGNVDFQAGNGNTALMSAAQQSNTSQGYERAALLISKDAKLDIVNDKDETALMLAAGAGNEKLVKLLLDKGADAQMKNGAGETVMSYANRAGNKDSAKLLKSQGVKPASPIVRESVIVDALIGTWRGFQDGLPQAIYTVALNKNGNFNFNSKLTPEILKQFPKGTMKATIAAQKGTYTFNGDTMIWNPVGAPPTSMKWKLVKGMLIIDNKIRLNKIK